jgi:protein O-GlcNAc transferase
MTDFLAAAQAALNAGQRTEAINHLIMAVTETPVQGASVYRVLVGQLYAAGRFADGDRYAAQGLGQHPRDYELLNTRGVLLRKLKRQAEAVPLLEMAVKVNAKHPAAQQNLGNILLDLGEGARAEGVFNKLARTEPRNPEYQRQLGRALARQGKIEPALMRLRQAVNLGRKVADPWLDMIGLLMDEHRTDEALKALDAALQAIPGDQRLLDAKAKTLRRAGRASDAAAFLTDLLGANPNAAWIYHQLGILSADRDRDQANRHFRRAAELDPGNLSYALALVESLERTRTGDEGGNIEAAYQLALKLKPRLMECSDADLKILNEVFVRVCDIGSEPELGDFRSLGRAWAGNGRHTALMKQLPRVRSPEDRIELLEQHRIWARKIEAAALRQPLARRAPRPANGKIRLGFMSSDLRQHPVGYFALPLFDHVDRDRFELFVYSFYQGQEDASQRHIAQRVEAYRWSPEISFRDAAQQIADDQLDMLIELGGSTHMNKLEVMAYRPAPIQASWLGYPHSAGLSTIDYFVCDPFIAPPDAQMLLEKPLVLKNAWYPLSPLIFRDLPEANATPPVAANGYVTFGTANQPYKYAAALPVWARIMARCPDSRFLFIRPEGSSAAFRDNIHRAFAAEGVEGDRILFEAVRGAHLPHYNRIDMSLDTFPQTGGTTTCESLWMGAPCVSLVGPAPYERLSNSVLQNAGLAELCAASIEDYVEIAVRLAGDPARIADLRGSMRDRLRASPVGQTEVWARDFYAAVEQAVTRAT